MEAFTLDDLRALLRECAGEPGGSLDGDHILDTTFAELGYDSLAVMEAAARVRRRYGVVLPEEVTQVESTLRAFVDAVRAQTQAQAV